jgi:hypothetical protein
MVVLLLNLVVVLEPPIVHRLAPLGIQRRLVPFVVELLDEVVDFGALEEFAV